MSRIALFLIAGLLSLTVAAGSTDREQATPQGVFDEMRAAFRPDKARGVHARYQFLISGSRGGEWWIEVKDGKNKMGRGRIENPDVILIASDRDWVALSNGKLSGVWASFTGRLKVRGSQTLARKLDEMFP